jgi:uncharacterized membrane protein YedE/YeeE
MRLAVLDTRPAWYVIGPVIGMVLVSLFALLSVRMGVLGGVTDVVERARGRQSQIGWKGWFAIGIVLGGTLFGLVAGFPSFDGYGWLSREGISDALIAPILVLAGVLIGYGAKYAGGCTSGNGLSGVSFGSAGSMVAMATFMGTAIVTAFVIQALT